MADTPRIGVILPVGPAPAELERLADTLASLACHEPDAVKELVLVDDGYEPRPLAELVRFAGARVTVIRTPLDKARSHPYSAMTAGSLAALAALPDPSLDWVLKLDTDALVIAPFAAAVSAVFAESGAGIVGACDADATGPRLRTTWHQTLHRAAWPIRVQRHGTAAASAWRLTVRRRGHLRAVRTAFRGMRAGGHELGRHCLGGAYAVSGPAVRALQQSGALDWRPWVGPATSEDVIVSTLVLAAGFEARDCVADGEVFGITHIGLPDTPENLVRRGFSIIHSVKNDERVSEDEIRAGFRTLRA